MEAKRFRKKPVEIEAMRFDDRYAEVVGEDRITDEVRKAMAL